MLANFDSSSNFYVVADDIELTQKSYIQFFEEASLLPRQKNVRLASVKVSDLFLEYYDNCLVHYCRQTRDLGIRHKDTCWVRNCEDIVSLGLAPLSISNVDLLYPRSRPYDLLPRLIRWIAMKQVFVDEEGWAFIRYLPPLDFSVKALLIRARYFLLTISNLRRRDRILDIVDSIIKNGWDNSRAIIPHPSVLIFHRLTNKFSVHTGRHRIAAVRYLYDVDCVPSSLLLDAVVISVPWGPLRTGRPYPGTVRCENCLK